MSRLPTASTGADVVRISDIMLVTLPDDGASPMGALPDELGRLLSTTTLLAGTSSVGLYWELYGVPSTSTVTYTLSVRSPTPRSLFATVFGRVIPGASSDQSGTLLSWEQSSTARAMVSSIATPSSLARNCASGPVHAVP